MQNIEAPGVNMPKKSDFRPFEQKIAVEYAKMKSLRARDAVYPFLLATYEAAVALKEFGFTPTQAKAHIQKSNNKPVVRNLIDLVSKESLAQRSKWTRALRYCLKKNIKSEELVNYMQKIGGINECANKMAKREKKRKAAENAVAVE